MRVDRKLVGAFVLVLLVICLLLTADRVLAPPSTVAVIAMTFVPWALPGYGLALLLALGLRRRKAEQPAARGRRDPKPVGRRSRLWSTVAVIAFLGAALHAGWLAPAYVGTHPSQEPSLTVLQLNTRFGEAAPAEVVQLARSRSADVVVLEELDPAAASRLRGAGLGKVLPHWVGDAHQGTMIYSRWPLRHARQLPVSKGAVLVQVAAPRPFWVIGLHTTQPAVSTTTTWAHDLREARIVARRQSGPGLVVGDLNATLDHAPVRLLLQSGLRDAAEAGDAGWQPTWPSSGGGRPLGVPMPFSLFALDHVLVTRHIGVVATRTLTVDGTDHKALVASLVR